VGRGGTPVVRAESVGGGEREAVCVAEARCRESRAASDARAHLQSRGRRRQSPLSPAALPRPRRRRRRLQGARMVEEPSEITAAKALAALLPPLKFAAKGNVARIAGFERLVDV